MKTIYLLRHSIAAKVDDLANELLPLSEEGIKLAKANKMLADYYFSSSFIRAEQTSQIIGDYLPFIVVNGLHEREIGKANHDFWLEQFLDHNKKNPGGESLNDAKKRMKSAMNNILSIVDEDKTALVISHGVAICAYLLNYLNIEVTNKEEKIRKFIFNNEVILEGKIEPLDGFILSYDNNQLVDIKPYKRRNQLC